MPESNVYNLQRYEKLLKAAQRESFNKRPASCSKCRYYQSDFKFRKCLFTRCPYKCETDVFRRRPLRRDVIVKAGTVRTDV